MTVISTKNGTRYSVAGLEGGKIVVRQPSGKRRLLTVKDTGRARFDAAVKDYIRRGNLTSKATRLYTQAEAWVL